MDDRADRRASRDFERTLSALAAVLDWLEVEAARAGVSAEALRSVQLAVDEIFANAVRHNARGRGEIRVVVGREGSRWIVAITDPDAPRFDPREQADPDTAAPLAERRPGGLGIHLVRRMVDRVEYAHEGRRGTTTLIKELG